jgi:hypothetical protein
LLEPPPWVWFPPLLLPELFFGTPAISLALPVKDNRLRLLTAFLNWPQVVSVSPTLGKVDALSTILMNYLFQSFFVKSTARMREALSR